MAITYTLPEIPARASNRPRPSGLLGVGAKSARPRNLTPYPDPLQKFPLSSEGKDINDAEDDDEGITKAIEIDFTPLPAALRRTPSTPSKDPQNSKNARRERRCSLPSAKGSGVGNEMPGGGKRRRGWIVPKEVIRDCLADLKRYVFGNRR